jgi:hypothetical protein
LVLAGVACALALRPAHAAYDVETIATTGPKLQLFERVGESSTIADEAEISINDAGTVAFAALKWPTSGIYTGTGGPLTTIATEVTIENVQPGIYLRNVGQPVINNAGTLAWFRWRSGVGADVLTGTSAPGVEIAATNLQNIYSSVGNISISTSGKVTYAGGEARGAGGIYSKTPGDAGRATIADSTGPEGDLQGFFDLIMAPHSVSHSGTAVFHAFVNATHAFGDFGDGGLYTGSGGATTLRVDDTGAFASFTEAMSLNESDTLAFVGTLKAPDAATGATDGIFLAAAGGAPVLIVPATEAGLSAFDGLCLANNGALSFTAHEGGGGRALFVRSAAGAIKRIIGSGDTLAGLIVGTPNSARSGLNEIGQVAFHVVFKDFQSGVFRASPLPPGSAPDAQPDVVTIRGTTKIDVLANDTPATGGTLKITAVSKPNGGRAVISLGKTITYIPGAAFTGLDSFTYTITSGGHTDTARVTVKNPFSALRGSYTQFFTMNGAPAGTLTATVTPAGGLTGGFTVNGKPYLLRGTVGFDGAFTQTFKRLPAGTPDLVVSLQFAVADFRAQMSGAIAGDAAPYGIAASAISVTGLPFGLEKGAYTVLLPPDANTANPQGMGYTTATLTSTGKLSFVGKLADGTSFTASSVLNADYQARLYVPLYVKPKGALAGTVTFGFSKNFTGPLTWVKPAPAVRSGLFQDGFSATTAASGHRYVLVKNVRALNYTDKVNAKADIHLRGGGFPDIDESATVTLLDKVTGDAPNAKVVNLTVYRTSGLVTGSFTPAAGTPGAKAVKFYGVLHQGENRAAGYFLGASQSGTVELVPR